MADPMTQCRFCADLKLLGEIYGDTHGISPELKTAIVLHFHYHQGDAQMAYYTTYHGEQDYGANYCPECGRRLEKWPG